MSTPNTPRWLHRLFWLLALCAFGLTLALFHRELLTFAAERWVVQDPPAKADVMVVLGGGVDTRPFEAARLYHQGQAARILYMDVKQGEAAKLGIVPSEREQTRKVLLAQKVPEEALLVVGKSVATTHEEALAVAAWATTNKIGSVLVVTDLFHTRRARRLFTQELGVLNVQVRVTGAKPREYGLGDWWHKDRGFIEFQNEIIKWLYALVKY